MKPTTKAADEQFRLALYKRAIKGLHYNQRPGDDSGSAWDNYKLGHEPDELKENKDGKAYDTKKT